MPIDRRITNGLAWAGALLVVAVPAADVVMSQLNPRSTPQVAMVDTEDSVDAQEAPAPSLPTPVSERPQSKPAATPAATEPTQAAAAPKPAADPVATATTRPASGDALDDFIQSGRQMPSYISDGGSEAQQPARPAQTATVNPTPSAQTPAPQTPAAQTPSTPTTSTQTPPTTPASIPAPAQPQEQVAALPRKAVTGFPTPVSQRPTGVTRAPALAQPPVVAQPPLIINQPQQVVTADDLEDWESGPLSEFLANRQGGSRQAAPDYDPDGFFLDEGPNSGVRVQRFPRAYEDSFYPFQ